MQRTLIALAAGLCLAGYSGLSAAAADKPEVRLGRIECGTPRPPADVNERFSDTWAYDGLKLPFVFSCYLIEHKAAGKTEYLLWDTGFAMNAGPTAPKESIIQQLASAHITPDQITYVGISHYHADHTGQVSEFPNATLLIGAGDWAGIIAPKPAPGVNAPPFAHWVSGGGKVEPVPLDKDVFGDGSVIMLYTPGHTPGHHSLLVKTSTAPKGKSGWVILTGDAAHFHQNWDTNGVPSFNYDRAQTLASIDRLKKIAAKYKATVIIQHDIHDVPMTHKPPFLQFQ